MMGRLTSLACNRVLSFLDESGLGCLAATGQHFAEHVGEPTLWQSLAISRDPRVVDFVGRGLLDVPEKGRRRDWKFLCRTLNPNVAPAAWPDESNHAHWNDLQDADGSDSQEDPEQDDARERSEFGPNGLWGGQSPHLFRIGPRRLAAVAGGYYPDTVGGAEVRPLHDVILIDLSDPPAHAASASVYQADDGDDARKKISVRSLIPGFGASRDGDARAAHFDRLGGRRGRLGDEPFVGHPHLHGAASDLLEGGSGAVFFGGGAPHGHLTDVTTKLIWKANRVHEHQGCSIDTVPADDITAEWVPVETAGEVPSARQGLRGVAFEGRFVIFGGRERGGQCLNDVWELDMKTPAVGSAHMWRQVICAGRAPSPRVWPSACHASYGNWLVMGGSMWQFQPDDEDDPGDYRSLYVLDLRQMQWSLLAEPAPPPALSVSSRDTGDGEGELSNEVWPPWVVASVLVPIGRRQVLQLGGTMPHVIGNRGLTDQSLSDWRDWYARLDKPYAFDYKNHSWSAKQAALGATGDSTKNANAKVADVLLRSHLAAVHVPERDSVIVFGGSRYFTGEYFHDLIELTLPQVESPTNPDDADLADDVLPKGRPPFMIRPRAGESQLTRGLKGRLRAMTRDGLLDFAQYNRIISTL